jgi:zinc transport system substrate-binding protein
LVVVSVVPQSFFVEKIADDLVRIEIMVPPGASPATYEPTLEQLAALSRASLYVKVGHPHFPFEDTWLEPLLEEHRSLPVVDASAGLELGDEDPHLWVAPRHARVMVKNIEAALATHLPEHARSFARNLDALLVEIDAVDADLREALRGKQGGRFVVLHPAWGHLAQQYGLVQLAIQREHKETNPRHLKALIEEARAAGIEVVFAQPHFQRAGAEVVARELGGRVEILDPLAYSWSENLREVARRLAEAIKP